jgi:hypothetical protein
MLLLAVVQRGWEATVTVLDGSHALVHKATRQGGGKKEAQASAGKAVLHWLIDTRLRAKGHGQKRPAGEPESIPDINLVGNL